MGKPRRIKSEEDGILLRSKVSRLGVNGEHYPYKGLNCAPVLTLQVFSESKAMYMQYYLAISFLIIVCLTASILVFICVRRSLSKKNKNTNSKTKAVGLSNSQDRGIEMTVPVTDNKDEVDAHIKNEEDTRLLNTENNYLDDIPEMKDKIEVAQVYMSQTSHDMVRNYRPSIPMPFRPQIRESNSCVL